MFCHKRSGHGSGIQERPSGLGDASAAVVAMKTMDVVQDTTLPTDFDASKSAAWVAVATGSTAGKSWAGRWLVSQDIQSAPRRCHQGLVCEL